MTAVETSSRRHRWAPWRRRRPVGYPTLVDREYWEALGREDGRRSLRTNGTGAHPAARELVVTFWQAVVYVQMVARLELLTIEERKAELAGRRDEVVSELSRDGAAHPSPPKRRVMLSELAEVERELERVELEREARKDLLALDVAAAQASAERADAAYRRAYHRSSRSSHALDAVDFPLPRELSGPLADADRELPAPE